MKYVLLYLLVFNPAFASDTFDFGLPDYGVYRNCDPQIDCTAKRDCNIKVSKDKRNCRACLIKNPFGGCISRGNDPTCEATKAAQNASYEAQAALRRLDCERLKEQSTNFCELEKQSKKLQCNAIKSSEESNISALTTQNQSLITLIEKASRMNASNLLLSELRQFMPNLDDIDLYFYQYSNYESLYMKVFQFFKANKYVLTKDIEVILGDELKTVYSFDQYTLVDLDYYLKVEDVIRAMFTAEMYEQFGENGVATLVKSEQVNIPVEIDNKVITVCELLEKSSTTLRCNTKAELYM